MPKPSRSLLHEWMHRFDTSYDGVDWIVRVWTQRSKPNAEGEFSLQRQALDPLVMFSHPDRILAEITVLPWVNAVEVLNEMGNGRLVYVDWP